MSPRRPVITRYSKKARTAATRRFTVDAAADLGRDRSARWTPCQSIQSNTSAASTADSTTCCSVRKRAKFATSKAYARTVARLNPRPAKCVRNAFAQSRPSQSPSIRYPPSTSRTRITTSPVPTFLLMPYSSAEHHLPPQNRCGSHAAARLVSCEGRLTDRGLFDQICRQICLGNAVKASRSARASSRCSAALGSLSASASMIRSY